MRVRIESDGTVGGTHVLTEDGKRIHGVRSIEWRIDADDPDALVTLVIQRVPLSLVSAAQTIEGDAVDATEG